jgi:DNA-binding NtrC family response regulator
MPVMSGPETFPHIKEICPHAKVIIYSGYELDHTAQSLLDQGVVTFIKKPFRIDQLISEIQKACLLV